MHRKLNVVMALTFLIINCHAQKGQEQGDFVRAELFKGQLTFSQNGGTQNVPLLVEEFIIDGGQKIPSVDFPFEGLLIIQLRGGELTTVENSKKLERDVNDFWVVPTNSSLQIITSDDSAIIRTYLIGKDYVAMSDGKSAIVNNEKQKYQYVEISKNLFAKDVQVIGDMDNPVVRIIDLNIGPGKTTESTILPGASQIQVTSGGAQLVINGKRLDKGLGATLVIAEGELLTIDNRQGEKAVKLRAMVFLK